MMAAFSHFFVPRINISMNPSMCIEAFKFAKNLSILCKMVVDKPFALEEPNLHLEFYLRDVTDGKRSPWDLPADVVRQVSRR